MIRFNMFLSRPPWASVKFIIAAVLILATTYYLLYSPDQISLRDYHFSSDSLEPPPGRQDALPPKPQEHPQPLDVTKERRKQEFIQHVIENEVGGPINLDPLSEICRYTEWQPGLIVKCQPVPGGIGNIRNMFLNCIRFALEAGATGLVVPEGRHRNEKDLSDILTQETYPFSYLLDTQFFTETFQKACPQVKLYQSDAELPIIVTSATQFNITPYRLAPKLQAHTLIDMPRPEWRRAFDKWLREESGAPSFSADAPVLIYIANSLLRWPLMYDTAEFVAQFGRILRIREDARRLAGAVLWSMSEKYDLNLDYSNPDNPLPAGKWMGAHLRTAADATKAGWPGYDSQEKNYISSANKTSLDLIYLTTGAPGDVTRFAETAKKCNIKVVTKEALLNGDMFEEERNALENMDWDQRALIDFEVVLRAGYFVGIFESSFSWNIALRRHVVVGMGTWLEIGPGKQGLEGLINPAEAFKDTYSAIFGPVDLGIRWQFPLGLFP